LPPALFWENQHIYEVAFGSTWRISSGSLLAFVCGEFVNSYVLAKMMILTAGRCLRTRTIGSTIFGEAVDSLLYYPLAFNNSGIIPNDKLPVIMLAQLTIKVGVEVVFTPVTYIIVSWLERAEQEDYYDRDTNFNPFALKS
jgi:queuosine precursor transporter